MATPKFFAWEKSDVERLVEWIEENQEALRGSKNAWVKDCNYWCYWKPLHGGREYYEYIFAAD